MAWVLLQLHFDSNWGRSIAASDSISLSFSPPTPALSRPTLHGQRPVYWSFQTTHHPSLQGQASCILLSLSGCPSNLSGRFTLKCLLTGPHLREAEANLNLPRQLTRPRRIMLQVSGLAEAEKINHLKISLFSPECHQLDPQENETQERGICPGWTAHVLWSK